MVAAWRIRSAVLVVPWHKLVTVSVPTGVQREARVLTGMACSRRISTAVTGWCRWAAWTAESSTHSHWQAVFSRWRSSPVPRRAAGPGSAIRAPCSAIRRAHRPSSSRRARATGTEVTTGAHSERSSRDPSGRTATWVCSRSRPAASAAAAASSLRAAGSAGRGWPGRPVLAGAGCKNMDAFSSASRAWMLARDQVPGRLGFGRAPASTAAMSAEYRAITVTTPAMLRVNSWTCPARAVSGRSPAAGSGGPTARRRWARTAAVKSPKAGRAVTAWVFGPEASRW